MPFELKIGGIELKAYNDVVLDELWDEFKTFVDRYVSMYRFRDNIKPGEWNNTGMSYETGITWTPDTASNNSYSFTVPVNTPVNTNGEKKPKKKRRTKK